MMVKLRKSRLLLLVAIILCVSKVAFAQQNGMNAYSPYTMYGIGNLEMLGSVSDKGMAGAGVASRNPVELSIINPAALSATPQQTFLYTFGVQGNNDYLSTGSKSTSSNKFNFSEISFKFPIARKLGFAVSLNPYSNVGYDITLNDTDSELSTTIGPTKYQYTGIGSTTLVKANIGWEPVKGLSVGFASLFYHSSIDRSSITTINPLYDPTVEYRGISSVMSNQFTKVNFEFGAIYAIPVGKYETFNIGATYQTRADINEEISKTITAAGSSTIDTVSYVNGITPTIMPEKITAGVAYNSPKWIVALDYIQQDYTGMDDARFEDTNVAYTKYQDFRLGFSYTPNRYDVRNAMNRWTYRAGVRYGDSYLSVDGNKIKDKSITLGAGIPLSRISPTMLNIAVDLGQRGSVKKTLLSEKYIKVHVGVNFFSANEWFVRHKFK